MIPGLFADKPVKVVIAADPAVDDAEGGASWYYADSAPMKNGAPPTVFEVLPVNSWQQMRVAADSVESEQGAVSVAAPTLIDLLQSNVVSIDGDSSPDLIKRFANAPAAIIGSQVLAAIMQVGDVPTAGRD